MLVDNADIRQIRPDDVRRNIGVVMQNPVLFSGSIRDNIMMGNPDASDADLLEAAKQSGVDAFVPMLPGGYDFPCPNAAESCRSACASLWQLPER